MPMSSRRRDRIEQAVIDTLAMLALVAGIGAVVIIGLVILRTIGSC